MWGVRCSYLYLQRAVWPHHCWQADQLPVRCLTWGRLRASAAMSDPAGWWLHTKRKGKRMEKEVWEMAGWWQKGRLQDLHDWLSAESSLGIVSSWLRIFPDLCLHTCFIHQSASHSNKEHRVSQVWNHTFLKHSRFFKLPLQQPISYATATSAFIRKPLHHLIESKWQIALWREKLHVSPLRSPLSFVLRCVIVCLWCEAVLSVFTLHFVSSLLFPCLFLP